MAKKKVRYLVVPNKNFLKQATTRLAPQND
jgi:hypothetical protein